VLALSGLLASGGDPAREPLQPPAGIVQRMAGVSCFTGAVAALWGQEAALSGPKAEGSHQDMDFAILDVLVTSHENAISRYSYTGDVHKREGNRLRMAYPWTLLPCKDGHVGIIGLPRQWDVLCLWMEREDLINDPLFATPHARSENADALDAEMTAWTMRHTKEDLFRECQARHLPVGAVYTEAECLENRHLTGRGFFV